MWKTIPIRGEWQARVDNELQWARELGNIDRPNEYSDLKHGFPHNAMPIFARNGKIYQDLNARERKHQIKAEQDHKTWIQ